MCLPVCSAEYVTLLDVRASNEAALRAARQQGGQHAIQRAMRIAKDLAYAAVNAVLKAFVVSGRGMRAAGLLPGPALWLRAAPACSSVDGVAPLLCGRAACACRLPLQACLCVCLSAQHWHRDHAHEAPPLLGPGALPTGPSHGNLSMVTIRVDGLGTTEPRAELRDALPRGAFPLVGAACCGRMPARTVLQESPAGAMVRSACRRAGASLTD